MYRIFVILLFLAVVAKGLVGQERVIDLPEVVFESRKHKLLHMLAYVREYSQLVTYGESTFLFREKLVDYMIPTDKKMKFKGWMTPRILKSRSYYRFTNSLGLDSVSNHSGDHFSWSDWIGVVDSPAMPFGLNDRPTACDTIHGRRSPSEIWVKQADLLSVDVDVLADTTARRWVPNLAGFFRDNQDFERFRLRFTYDNASVDSVAVVNLASYSYDIESNGRSRDLIRFNRSNTVNNSESVSTRAEVYFLDKEYIDQKEAKRWDKRDFDQSVIDIIESPDAPPLDPSILELIARVDSLDTDQIRLTLKLDQRRKSEHWGKPNKNFQFGHRVLNMLKDLTGIRGRRRPIKMR